MSLLERSKSQTRCRQLRQEARTVWFSAKQCISISVGLSIALVPDDEELSVCGAGNLAGDCDCHNRQKSGRTIYRLHARLA